MARDLNPKCKSCRRAGEKLFLKGERCNTAKCAIVKRNFPPGFHGPKGKKHSSDYGMQLNEKQKAKRQYILLEKQFQLTFAKALKQTGNTGENFLKLLEMRLDNVVYRLGIATSRKQSRQMVNHGLFTVNGNDVDIPSYQTRVGDVIAIKTTKKDSKLFKNSSETLKNKIAPAWLNLDSKALTGKVLQQPTQTMINPTFNIQMVIEYYSK